MMTLVLSEKVRLTAAINSGAYRIALVLDNNAYMRRQGSYTYAMEPAQSQSWLHRSRIA
jgi:hypothetical protein